MIRFFVEDVPFDTRILQNTPEWLISIITSHCLAASDINYIFCSDKYLLHVNQTYLKHDFYTDIITFDHRDAPEHPIESDIFISTDRVLDNASRLNIPFFNELLRVMAHGLLHLIGYDDHRKTEQQKMRSLEDHYVHLYFDRYHSSS